MKRKTLHTLAALLASLASLPAQDKATNLPPTDFRAFEIVVKNNIFNASRYPGGGDNSRKHSAPAIQVDSFSLLGTMSYEKGLFAFFGGSRTEYRTTLGPDDSIAGYRITEIAYDHVSLTVSNDPPVEIPIGGQMKREDNGPWRLNAHAEPVVSSSAASTAASSDSSASAGSNDAENEVLKRLMKKREQELSK